MLTNIKEKLNVMEKVKYILFTLFFVAILSCTKEGAVGPQGLDGIAGSKIHSGNSAPTINVGVIGDYYFDTSSSDFYGPKTATGWGNPINLRGATGAKGATGATGPAGSNGKDGNKIIAATGVPTMAVGSVGDFYIDLATSNLYGPKTTASWGTPLNLKGANGANGTKILNGTSVPTSSLGSVGDYYFQTTNANLYGPRTASGWGTPISLLGANGKDGANGKTILNGTTVPANTLGTVGDFYYRTNTGDFYGPKTAAGWGAPTNLKGTNGQDGAPGSQILSGTAVPSMSLGRIGDFYFRTSTSDFYGPKTATTWGTPVNLRGATGPAGTNGSNGAPGSKIYNGSGDPSDAIGVVGDYYIDISTGDLYGPKTTTWGSKIMNLRGPSSEVIYSPWLKLDEYYDDTDSYGVIYIPVLAKYPDFIDNASIVIYAQEFKGSDFTTPLGIYQLNYYSSVFDAFINYRIDKSKVIIYQLAIGRSYAPINDMLYRYVIIPGNIHVDKYGLKMPANYAEFQKMYNIKD